jgi:hypothetical protein
VQVEGAEPPSAEWLRDGGLNISGRFPLPYEPQ